ncbi:MAG: hypothetical protein V3W14_06255, partial [Candidatus Neomarinimicrobiota bacterium]
MEPEITSKELIGHIQYLASDEREGRYPGTTGSLAAVEYIAGQWAASGLLPPDGMPDYRQTFDMISGVSMGTDCALAVGSHEWEAGIDFVPLGFSSQGTFSGGAVYAGFGLADDDSTSDAQPNFAGQWLLVFQPPDVVTTSPHGFRNASLVDQALHAKDAGVVGLIVISSPEA